MAIRSEGPTINMAIRSEGQQRHQITWSSIAVLENWEVDMNGKKETSYSQCKAHKAAVLQQQHASKL